VTHGSKQGSNPLREASPAAKPIVLVVDDRDAARELIATELEEAGNQVVQVADGLQAWEKFQLYHFDLVISDLRMPRSDGMSLLRRICSSESPNPQVPVLLVSAYGSLSTAAEAGRAGAIDFFPFSDSGIEELIRRAISILNRAEHPLPLPFLGESLEAARLRERADAMASLDAPVLVCGERGSGRASIARYIHQQSRHGSLPFVSVAHEAAASMLSRVQEGTVYLRDLDHFDPSDQKRWFERVRDLLSLGASARLRIIASTEEAGEVFVSNRDVNEDAARQIGRFRIDVVSLSRRKEDLPALIDELHRRAQRRLGKGETHYEAGAREALTSHRWRKLDDLEAALESLIACAPRRRISRTAVAGMLREIETPLDKIDQERRRAERRQLIELYRKHGTYSGVARELGITRNAAKYRLAKYDLLPPLLPDDQGSQAESQ
jgi:DNA-binding NtrC family response regulator